MSTDRSPTTWQPKILQPLRSISPICLTRLIFLVRCLLFTQSSEKHHHRARCRSVVRRRNQGSFLPLNDVVRWVEGGVDPSAPRIRATVASRRQLEVERLPIRV